MYNNNLLYRLFLNDKDTKILFLVLIYLFIEINLMTPVDRQPYRHSLIEAALK